MVINSISFGKIEKNTAKKLLKSASTKEELDAAKRVIASAYAVKDYDIKLSKDGYYNVYRNTSSPKNVNMLLMDSVAFDSVTRAVDYAAERQEAHNRYLAKIVKDMSEDQITAMFTA